MFQRLRRLRLLALLALLASPGLGGSVLPAIMPCPVDVVVSPAHAAEGHAASHSDHGSLPDSSDTSECCTCLGACCPGAIVSASAVRLPDSHLVQISTARDFLPDSFPPSPPLDRLPPATAPPVIV